MRHLRTVLPSLVAACAVGVTGVAFALAGAAPAISAASPTPSAISPSAGPVAGLLAGSYEPSFARLSVPGGAKIISRRAPAVAAKAQVGRRLSVTAGSWKPAKVSLTYAWYSGSTKIKGATSASYTPTPGVAGSVVSVRVTASRQGYRPATVGAKAGTVRSGTLSSVSDPVVRGTAKVGAKLRVTPGTWSPRDVSLSYEWLMGRKVLSTSSSYTVQRSVRGEKLRVAVTATRPGYRAVTVLSAPTERVKG